MGSSKDKQTKNTQHTNSVAKRKSEVETAIDVNKKAKTASKEQSTKNKTNEIDAIFSLGGVKSGKDVANPQQSDGNQDPVLSKELQDIAERIKKSREDKCTDAHDTSKKTKVEGNKEDIFGDEVRKSRKKTEEGYAIYSEAELGLNKTGGDTPLCPFDCDCCF